MSFNIKCENCGYVLNKDEVKCVLENGRARHECPICKGDELASYENFYSLTKFYYGE